MAVIDAMIPCLCGRISLDGKRFPLAKNQNSELIFSNPSGSVVFYRLGSASNIHSFKSRQGTAIIIGTLYSPLQTGYPFDKSTVMTENIFKLNLKDLEGNFVLISYQSTVTGILNMSIATDRFGTRMALYYQQNDSLFFSTHISGIRFLLEDRLPPIAEDSLLHFYHFGFTANDRTLFSGINKIPPGSRLLISDQKVKLEKYFDLWDLYKPSEYAGMDENEIAERINASMADAIIRRNPLKQPLVITLSGGVDSGFIAKKSRQLGINLVGFNLAYGNEYNEFSRVDKLKMELNIKLNKLIATPEMLIESVEESNKVSSEPIKFNEAAMRLLAIEAKKEGFESIWDGDGADRLFFGMNRQFEYNNLFKKFNVLKKFGMTSFLLKIIKHIKTKDFKKLFLLFQNWMIGIPPYPERKLDRIVEYDQSLEKFVFDLCINKYWKEYSNKIKKYDLILYFTYQSICMCPEMFFHPISEQDSILGLTQVSPYWDNEMVSLALSIPSKYKILHGKTKFILRKAAAEKNNYQYWMMPKIGLQDAFTFCIKSPVGDDWRNKQINLIKQSESYEIISRHLNNKEINLNSLLMFNYWKILNTI